MIVASKVVIEFIRNQPSITKFAEDMEVSRETIYNILGGENVSSEMVEAILTKTGFQFEKAFEIKEE